MPAIRRRKSRSANFNYKPLEDRRLLATTASFDGGILRVQMNAGGDFAELVTFGDDSVGVNGSTVANGSSTVKVDDVSQILINGNNQNNQQVSLDGFFDNGELDRVVVVDVSKIDLIGTYEISGDFLVNAPQASELFDGSSGEVIVGGNTNINYSAPVNLFSASHDFQGTFSATGTIVAVADGNGIQFGNVNLTESLAASALGEITQANGTSIQAAGRSGFQTNAQDINLPNSGNDFGTLQLFFADDIFINDRNSIEFDGMYANGNVEITAGGDINVPYVENFEFNNNYLSSNPAGTSLTPVGTGTFGDGDWSFQASGGLLYAPGELVEEYYVEMDVAYDELPLRYNKLLDFKSSTSDDGLYLLGDRVVFYVPGNSTFGEMRLTPGQQHTIGLLRSDGIVTAYLDGKSQFFFEDTNSLATFENLGFFKDDFRTAGREALPGTVDAIRISQEKFTFVGNLTLDAGGDVDLSGATSFVGGNLSVKANDFTIRASSELKFQNVHIRNDANISSTGRIVQTGPEFRVTGSSDITANYNINLSRPANNFVGPVSVFGANVVLQDKNSIQLDQVHADTSVIVTAGDFITNANGADLSGRFGDFRAKEIRLGNRAGDKVSFLQSSLQSERRTEYYQEGSIRLRNLTATSAVISSDASIFDSNTSTIDVRFNAKFVAPRSISLGDAATDSVATGQVTLQSDGYVGFTEESDVRFVGNSWGNFIFVDTDGEITDTSTASIDARNGVRLKASSATLGEDTTNKFSASSTTLVIDGDAWIRQITNLRLNGTSVVEGDLTLESTKNVVDTFSSFMDVLGHLHVKGNLIFLGDRLTSHFTARSFSFDGDSTTIQFDRPAIFGGESKSNYANIFANGAIGNLNNATLDVSGRTILEGSSIRLGGKVGDRFETRQVEFRSQAAVDMEFDRGVVIAGNSTARSLRILTPQFIADTDTSNLEVERHTRFIANSIAVGEKTTDRFASGTLSFVSAGSVTIREDSNMRLFGPSSANRLVLQSTGSITDDANAETMIQERATLTAVDLIIGDMTTDCFDIAAGAGGLVTNANNVNVTLGC